MNWKDDPRFVQDGDCIYFMANKVAGRFRLRQLAEDEWLLERCMRRYFRPGHWVAFGGASRRYGAPRYHNHSHHYQVRFTDIEKGVATLKRLLEES